MWATHLYFLMTSLYKINHFIPFAKVKLFILFRNQENTIRFNFLVFQIFNIAYIYKLYYFAALDKNLFSSKSKGFSELKGTDLAHSRTKPENYIKKIYIHAE